MILLEPWILARLAAGLAATWLFLYAAFVGVRVLRNGHLGVATEGRLLLERQAELAATAARVAGVVQVLALLLSALAADRLSRSLKGAMCGYGVVHANGFGPWAMGVSVAAALSGAVFAGLLRFESRLATPLFRSIALASLPLAALASADLVLTASWLSSLDFSVVASCCSTSLDGAASGAVAFGSGRGRLPIAGLAVVLVSVAAVLAAVVAAGVAAGVAARSSRRELEPPRSEADRDVWIPRRGPLLLVGALAALAVPVGVLAVILEVSPHVYEAPQHLCAYCLLRLDALAIGYPLIGALVLGASFALSTALAAMLAPRTSEGEEALGPFAVHALRRVSFAFALFLLLGIAPVVRFTILSGGKSLFP